MRFLSIEGELYDRQRAPHQALGKEHVLEAAAAELKEQPDKMRQRKQIVEHPYGTIKHWMGSTHFLMKRLPNVQAEMSLHVLAYNLRRAISVLGVPRIMEQLQAA